MENTNLNFDDFNTTTTIVIDTSIASSQRNKYYNIYAVDVDEEAYCIYLSILTNTENKNKIKGILITVINELELTDVDMINDNNDTVGFFAIYNINSDITKGSVVNNIRRIIHREFN